jgi:hypothetical protein
MAKSTLKIAALVFALAGAVALATPSWASGATSAVKKAGPDVRTDALHYNPIGHSVRYQDVGATGGTEFSSANRTGGHNVKWK